MSDKAVDGIDALVQAVLYEGHQLYPYRPSSLKNQKRFAFGVVYPRAYAEHALEAAILRVEVVATSPAITGEVRFLLLPRTGAATECRLAIERPENGGGPFDAHVVQRRVGPSSLVCTTAMAEAGPGLWRYAMEIRNDTTLEDPSDREAALDVSPASTHVILRGQFVSSIDPPAHAADAVAACRCTGLYPILAGKGAMLASPIILPDYPEIAPQSPGDWFDGLEIDEMLTLRVLTMTPDEKREAAAANPRIAALIARTEELGIENTAKLHGVVKTSWPRQGTRVRIRPAPSSGKRRADAMDVILAGKVATVAGVERDLDGRIHCAVTIDEDPGADLGATGMPGHRFFFAPDELEVLA